MSTAHRYRSVPRARPSPRTAAALSLIALLLAPLAAAHGDEPDSVFNPLQMDWALHLAPGGAAAEDAPAAGSVAFGAVSPASEAPPLAFAYQSPVKHVLGIGVDVTLKLQADAPVLAQGDAFELTLLLEGAPIPDASKRVALSKPALAPGDIETVRVVLNAPAATFEKGANVALRVRVVLPVLAEGALKLLVGPSDSAMTLESMRVPSVLDLELQETPLVQFDARSESFRPGEPGAIVVLGIVRHDAIELNATRVAAGTPLYLVLKGDESAADAEAAHAFATREKRVAAAHELRVGSTLVRVIPSIGVVVPLGSSGLKTVTCARNCPAAFSATLGSATADTPSTGPTVFRDDKGTLVPPPPATDGVPQSKDAPTKETSALPVAAIIVALLALAAARRR
jgi:hypothetical protein